MAKLTLNSALMGIRGRIDSWVYRRLGDRMIIARRPTLTRPPSPSQLEIQERFRSAAAYVRAALADPVSLMLYRASAKIRGMPTFARAMADYLNPPEVKVIDATACHGVVGNPVKVVAYDDFEVVGVHVVIRDDASAVLEQGPAVLADGLWTYATTVPVAAGETVTIEATATDRPGHTGSLVQTRLIA